MQTVQEEFSPAALKSFDASLESSRQYPLMASGISIFQVNMGRVCNQACRHCHVEAGPNRIEAMSRETIDVCLDILEKERYPVVDITGGAPEMNPGYRYFVEACRSIGCHVKTRSNLSILLEEGYGDLPDFWAKNGVEVIASLPYYLEETTDKQRGKGIFSASIEAIRKLNGAGFGIEGSPLTLCLVYNPCGAYLPPSQRAIEADFRRELKKRYGVTFTTLYTITNMPIGRFLKFLKDSGNLKRYLERLQQAYNPAAAENVMCRQTISIGYDGSLYDCDFNQMLGLKCGGGVPQNVSEFDSENLSGRKIATGIHCYGCTAGAGSSCSGAVA